MISAPTWESHPTTYKSFLQSLASKTFDELTTAEVAAASYHCNPHVPWGDDENSALASTIVAPASTVQLEDIIRPMLLNTKTPKKSLANLAQAGVNQAILEEDSRRVWKAGESVGALGTVWPLIERSSRLVVPFLLALFDDHEIRIKIQACWILRRVLDVVPGMCTASGLLEEFRASVDVCLSYVPPSTPTEISISLLSVAYPCALGLAAVSSSKQRHSSILMQQVLASMDRLDHNWRLLRLLMSQLTSLIKLIGPAVIMSLSRINQVINAILINPYVVDDYDMGLPLIEDTLNIQTEIIDMVAATNDPDVAEILRQYRYDFYGAWIVLNQHVDKLPEGYAVSIKHTMKDLKSKTALDVSQVDESLKVEVDKI
ncbi:hypothetical protein DICA3_A06612 [Diutina catenulata]